MKRVHVKRLALAFAALLLAAQAVPVARDNPPHEGELQAPPERKKKWRG